GERMPVEGGPGADQVRLHVEGQIVGWEVVIEREPAAAGAQHQVADGADGELAADARRADAHPEANPARIERIVGLRFRRCGPQDAKTNEYATCPSHERPAYQHRRATHGPVPGTFDAPD